jgi:ABC-2 type transport system permease protein
VHGFKAILLKDAGFVAIRMDLLYLTVSAFVMITIATALFKRTL